MSGLLPSLGTRYVRRRRPRFISDVSHARKRRVNSPVPSAFCNDRRSMHLSNILKNSVLQIHKVQEKNHDIHLVSPPDAVFHPSMLKSNFLKTALHIM
jgi:hypothetical protein